MFAPRTVLLFAVSLGLCAGCPRSSSSPPSAPASHPAGAASQPAGDDVHAPPPGGFVVGTGTAGFSDDPPQFSKPIRLAAYGPGRVVVADIGNHALRAVSKDGTVTTLVGGPDKAGHQDGPAVAAKLNSPHGVAVNKDGSIVVAEASNHTLRLLTPDEQAGFVVSTLAGVPGQSGFADGPAATAQFASPHGILLDADGSVLVADIGNARLRRVHDGQVTTVAGTGQAGHDDGALGTGTLHMPMDLARAAGSSVVLIADAGAKMLRAFSAPTGLSTPRVEATFAMPHGVAVDDQGRVVVADLYQHQVVATFAEEPPRPVLGTGQPGAGGARLNRPAAVLIHDGLLWIADLDNHQVKAIPWPPGA